MPNNLASAIVAITLVAGASSAFSQTTPDIKAPTSSAYLQDSRGVIVRTPYGLCWRTGPWTPADAVPGCDGDLVPPVVKPTAPPIVVATPEPVAKPAPVAVPKRCDFAVTLGNDQAFGFDRATLNNAAKKRIDDEIMTKLANCAKVDTILVTGHADRLGTQLYNQKLSEKRADAVAGFLKSRGVSAEINTLGAGKTQSIKSCDDKLPRAKLVECLAPNRRVVVEVRGLAR